jgi:uncharacterized protein
LGSDAIKACGPHFFFIRECGQMADSDTTSVIKASFNLRLFVRQLHWISAALSLFGLTFYAFTGFALNNEDLFKAKHDVTRTLKPIPASLLANPISEQNKILSSNVRGELSTLLGVDMADTKVRVDQGKVSLSIPSPGVKTIVKIDQAGGMLTLEQDKRGFVSAMTDLHKGKNVRPIWGFAIDAMAISVLIFALSGLYLLVQQARQRGITWPLIAGGTLIPIIFAWVISR